MDLGIPPLKLKILLESKPSEIQNLSTDVGRAGIFDARPGDRSAARAAFRKLASRLL